MGAADAPAAGRKIVASNAHAAGGPGKSAPAPSARSQLAISRAVSSAPVTISKRRWPKAKTSRHAEAAAARRQPRLREQLIRRQPQQRELDLRTTHTAPPMPPPEVELRAAAAAAAAAHVFEQHVARVEVDARQPGRAAEAERLEDHPPIQRHFRRRQRRTDVLRPAVRGGGGGGASGGAGGGGGRRRGGAPRKPYLTPYDARGSEQP